MDPVTTALPTSFKAVQIDRFGGIDSMHYRDVALAHPAAGQVMVRVAAAGVGPWDAWIRAGKSALPQTLPLTLGSDLSGVVAAIGPGVSGLRLGDAVFGVTNPNFTGAAQLPISGSSTTSGGKTIYTNPFTRSKVSCADPISVL